MLPRAEHSGSTDQELHEVALAEVVEVVRAHCRDEEHHLQSTQIGNATIYVLFGGLIHSIS